VPLLPRSLRELWKEDLLPNWLIGECRLPPNSTIAALGPSFWNSQRSIPPRVQHFVEFLIKSRIKSIESVRHINRPWPVGLEVTDIPFSVRAANTLETSGLLRNKEALAETTFGQLLRTPSLGLKSLLEVTTLIEAAIDMHWRATAELAKSLAVPSIEDVNNSSSESSTADVLTAPLATYSVMDERWAAQLSEALREPWVDQIDEHDARFKRLLPPGHGTVEERIERAISDPASASVDIPALIESLPRIRDGIDRLNSQSLEESLLELLSVHLSTEQPRLNVIAGRLGWLGEDPKTLQECGDMLTVTRERVRQIEAKLVPKLTKYPLYLPQLDAGLAVLEDSAPISIARAANLLVERGVCRRPFSPISLIETAKLFGRKTTLSVERHESEHIVISGEQGQALGIAARVARRIAGQAGVASVYQVVDAIHDLLAPLDPPNIDEDDVRRFLDGHAGCEFLNEDWFWYTDTPEGRNRLENVAKKILSVASPQSVASIREGVRRVYRWRSSSNARYRSLTVPPQSVIARFLERHPDFHLHGDSVTSVKSLDYRRLLGQGEQALVDALRTVSTGVVDRRTLVQECLSRGINENTLSVYTSYSSILEHIGTGLWQLRGVRVDPAAVEAVREQNALRPRETRVQDFGWSSDGKLWVAWTLPVITGSLVFGIPGAIKRYLSNQSFAARPKGVDRNLGKISINDTGTSYGYQPFLRYIGADEGDLLLAEFDLAQSQVVLSINNDRMLEDA
jgi:hypothetical protein